MAEPAGNAILDGLTPAARETVLSAGEIVPLERGQILYDFDAPVGHVWLPLSGLVSWITAAPDSMDTDAVETAITGNEGFVGVQVLLEGGSVSGRSFVLIAGEALRIEAAQLHALTNTVPGFLTCLNRYVLALLVQTTQLSLCNRLHPVEGRCARWLLMCHDRMGGAAIDLTHEALAQMLGVRRASVTVALGTFSKAGMIDSHYGQVRILDRPALERSSCGCYRVLRREYERLLGF